MLNLAMRTSRYRLLVYLLMTVTVPHLFLFSPRPSDELANATFCGHNVHVTRQLAFGFSCDSFEFLRLADSPSLLLEFHNVRQSRPVGIVLAAALSRVTGPLQKWLNWYPYAFRHDAFLAYLLLSFAVVFLSLVFFDWITVQSRSQVPPCALCLAVGSMLVVNDVVKVFIWTPHVQIFNILVPLFCIAVCMAIIERPQRTLRQVFGVSLGLGVLALAYFSFAIVVPAGVIAFFVGERLAARQVSVRYFLSRLAMLVLGFCCPIVLWGLFVYWKTGRVPYSHEVTQYRQFVWMVDAMRDGAGVLVRRLASFVSTYAQSLRRVALVPVLILLALVLARFFSWKGRGDPFISSSWNSLMIASGITAVAVLLFFGLLGFYADRLTWSIVPPSLVAAVPFGSESWARLSLTARKWLGVLWIAGAIAWLVFEVLKPGPYL
jgi:hypothetical protein